MGARVRAIGRKVKKGLAEHLVDSSAIVTVSNPLFTAIEITAGGMSNDLSQKARTLGILTLYGGVSFLIDKGRRVSRRIFKITQESRERAQWLHDTLYLATFNALTAPGFYYFAGARTFREYAVGTLGAIGFGLFGGGLMMYAKDAFRDLLGLETCRRRAYPDLVRRQNPKIKKGLAVAVAAGSLALMNLMYSLNPKKTSNPVVEPTPIVRVDTQSQ